MMQENARSLFGDTDEVSCVPDALLSRDVRDVGPVYDVDGALILAESFSAGGSTALGDLHGARLADAFCIWECYADARAKESPLLLRFDDFDVIAVASPQGPRAVWRGVVDTSAAVKAVRADANESERVNDASCLIWKRVLNWKSGMSAEEVLSALV